MANGLAFLHQKCNPVIQHRYVNPKNILLDTSLEVAKLADIGWPLHDECSSSRQRRSSSVRVHKFKLGYLDPEYIHTLEYTTASDVYTFGLVIIQTVMGEAAPYASFQKALKAANQEIFPCREVQDLCMPGDAPPEVLRKLIHLGIQCCNQIAAGRPAMMGDGMPGTTTVVSELGEILAEVTA